jgi:hypothetical protein
MQGHRAPSGQFGIHHGLDEVPGIHTLSTTTHVTSVRSTTMSSPLGRNVLCVTDVAFPPVPRYLLV